jgi:hypothetical protein
MLDAITKVKWRALWFPILAILKSFGIQIHFHQGTALQFTMVLEKFMFKIYVVYTYKHTDRLFPWRIASILTVPFLSKVEG